MTSPSPDEASAIRAAPAQYVDGGFRLLVLREIRAENEPPAFAWIDQNILRAPQRLSRHGLFFGRAFLPEIVAWLSQRLGRPTLHADAGEPYRNRQWPSLTWRSEDRLWPEGVRTVEWSVEVVFQDEADWAAFRLRWEDRLSGEIETPASTEADCGLTAPARSH